MKLSAIVLAAVILLFALSACTVVEDPGVRQTQTVVNQAPAPKPRMQFADRDISAEVLLLCDRLGFRRQDEGWRLCALRGMDRYIDPRNGTVLEQLHQKDEALTRQQEFLQQQQQFQPQLSPGSYYIKPEVVPYYSTPYPPASLPGYPNYPTAK